MDKKQQILLWSRLYGRSISNGELTEINANLNGFFATLKQWSDEAKKTSNENE